MSDVCKVSISSGCFLNTTQKPGLMGDHSNVQAAHLPIAAGRRNHLSSGLGTHFMTGLPHIDKHGLCSIQTQTRVTYKIR